MNYNTPFFLINKDELELGLYKLKSALEENWNNYIIGYSYKTNSLPWIIHFFNDNGCYAEVVSDDEYRLAKSIGAGSIIYNGIAKSKDTFIEAVRNHCIVNIDSSYEIEWLGDLNDACYEVGIRVNFDLESKCPGQTQCGEDGERFGFCYENGELKRAIDMIEKKGHMVTGLHLHKSSKTRLPDIYRAISETAVEISENYNLKLKYIDIGGGFFGGLESKPQFSEYFGVVRDILCERFCVDDTMLIVEPGMALIGAYIDYFTSVLDIKKTTRNVFVVTDGSRTHIDPLMNKQGYFYDIEVEAGYRNTIERQIITGYTCMEHDRLFEIKNGKELIPGDRIIYHKVGAYTMCLSPLFIKWFPDVYVRDGEKIVKVRNRWDDNIYKHRSLTE